MISTIKKIPKVLEGYIDDFLHGPREILIYKLSLLFIVAFTKSDYGIHIPLRILALYMIFSDKLCQSKSLWGILALGNIAIIASQWDYIDNHKYLSCYWLTACYLSLYAEHRLKYLQNNARILVGLVFTLATFHKIIWGEYLDGSFFHFTYLVDQRFADFVTAIANFTPDVLQANNETIHMMRDFPLDYAQGTITSHANVRNIALFSSYWVILIEGSVGLSFLFALKSKFINKIKDWILLLFIFSTYGLVMVAGFNYMLVLLGISSTKLDARKTTIGYMLALMVFEMRNIPWSKYALHLFAY